MTITSDFFNHYKNLEKSLDTSIPTKETSEKLISLIKKNLNTLGKLSTEDLQKCSLNFAKNGSISLDQSSRVLSAFNKHIFQYSTSSDDVRRDLFKFSEFVNKYLQAHLQDIDAQQIFVLQTMVQQSITGLKKLEAYTRTKSDPSDVSENEKIVKSRKRLEKTLDILQEGLQVKRASPQDTIKNQALLIKEQEVGVGEQVLFIKNQLEEIRRPSTVFDKTTIQKYQKEKLKIGELDEIDHEIDLITRQGIPSSDELFRKLEKLLQKKQRVQTQPSYLQAKEFIAAYQSLISEHNANYRSIFASSPYKEYKIFVDQLKSCYPNSEDRKYLLSSLVLTTPRISDLLKVQEKLEEISPEFMLSGQVNKLKRGIINKSKIFEGSVALIQLRKKKKTMILEQDDRSESVTWKLGRATGNFIAVGGIATLVYFFPPSSASLGLIPKFAKAGLKEIKDAWKGSTSAEKHEIAQELGNLLQQVKENPTQAVEKISQIYSKTDKDGREIQAFVNQAIEIAKTHPSSLDEIINSLKTK